MNANSTSQATLVDYAESYHAVVCSSTNKHYGFNFFFFFFFFFSYHSVKKTMKHLTKLTLTSTTPDRIDHVHTCYLCSWFGRFWCLISVQIYHTQATLRSALVWFSKSIKAHRLLDILGLNVLILMTQKPIQPSHKKTNNMHRRKKAKMSYAKTKAQISCAVTAQPISAIVFAVTAQPLFSLHV